MHMNLEDRIQAAYQFIRERSDAEPNVGLVLGSGLGDFCDALSGVTTIHFNEIPGFPVATVAGHTGAFLFGRYHGIPVVALRGRIHFYEGYTQQEITMPVRIMRLAGVNTLILTNAAGGINLSFSAGALMQITDHINFSGGNPLIGPNLDRLGPRFPDMGDIYTRTLREELNRRASAAGIELKQGIYAMYSGPSFETPAEIRFFRSMGADAVGMSTVPEAIVARHCGMRVMGISCITNMAAGILDQQLTHAEVVETANRVKAEFTKVVELAIELAQENPTSIPTESR